VSKDDAEWLNHLWSRFAPATTPQGFKRPDFTKPIGGTDFTAVPDSMRPKLLGSVSPSSISQLKPDQGATTSGAPSKGSGGTNVTTNNYGVSYITLQPTIPGSVVPGTEIAPGMKRGDQ
jgi:hypothetical protein